MAIDYKINAFPSLPISKQLFYAGGQAVEGGLTVGGVRMMSPEPGGRSSLELQLSLQTGEWDYPLASWLMSKTNGDIFRIRLAPTPQIAIGRAFLSGVPWQATGIYPETPWSNQQNWAGDAIVFYTDGALEGTVFVKLDMSSLGQILRPGHLIGHLDNTYLIDEITYDNSNNVATILVKPPLRKNVVSGDTAYLRPYFLGTIANGSEMRKTYDAINAGHIQMERIIFNEINV